MPISGGAFIAQFADVYGHDDASSRSKPRQGCRRPIGVWESSPWTPGLGDSGAEVYTLVAMKRKRRTVGISKAEARLVRALRKALVAEAAESRKQPIFAVELDSFQGIADLVTGQLNGHCLLPSSVSPSKLKTFSLSTAKVLGALLGRKTAYITEVERMSGLSRKTVRKQLRTLKDAGMVNSENQERVHMQHEVRPPFEEVIAYEVKVKDWKSGLRQALSYKSFANRAYLALPMDRADSLKKRLQIFRRFNVGLVGIGRTGKLKWLTKT